MKGSETHNGITAASSTNGVGRYRQLHEKKWNSITILQKYTPYTNINSRWIKDLKKSQDTIKVLEEKIGRTTTDIPHSNIFTDVSPRRRDIKERINKWDLIKIKSFCMDKITLAKWKGNQVYGKTYVPMISQTRVWSPKYIKNSDDSTLRRQAIQLKKGQKTWTDFSKEDIQRAQRHMKRCSVSLAIKEMQIKTTVR